MVSPKIIKGFNEKGEEVFSRPVREYDKNSIEQKILGISIGDIVKAVPIVFLCGMLWSDYKSTIANQNNFNTKITGWVENDSKAIKGINGTLQHIDVSLTQITGHAFDDGLQVPGATTTTTTTVQ